MAKFCVKDEMIKKYINKTHNIKIRHSGCLMFDKRVECKVFVRMNAVQCLALAHNPDTQTEISFTPNAVLLRARLASASDTVHTILIV